MEQQLTPFFWPPFFPPLKLWLHVILYLRDSPDGCDQHSLLQHTHATSGDYIPVSGSRLMLVTFAGIAFVE